MVLRLRVWRRLVWRRCGGGWSGGGYSGPWCDAGIGMILGSEGHVTGMVAMVAGAEVVVSAHLAKIE